MNNINLNGKEIIMGESIIIFMVMSIEVIIKLMIKKGKNSIKLIWKVVFNLEVIKVGISIVIDICLGVVICVLDIFIKVLRLLIWVCLSIKVLSGFCVKLNVWCVVICLLR